MPRLRSFPELLRRSADRFGSSVFLPRRNSRGGEPVTFRELHEDVRAIAAGLYGRGTRAGDHVGLIAENRYEWILCDQACAYIGAVDVPRGSDTPAAELVLILRHAGCKFVFVETAASAAEIASRRSELPELETLCVIEGRAPDVDGLDVLELSALRDEGTRLLATDPGAIDELSDAIERDDLLTIIYTSGTTANPNGVMLTHGNLLANIEMVEEVLLFSESDTALSILPAWHAYERIMDYVLLYAGSKLVYSDRRRIKEDLKRVRPSIFVAVPRIWEMLHDGVEAHARKLTGLQRRILLGALGVCRRVGSGRPRLTDRLVHPILSRTVLPKLLATVMGGNIRLAVSGGGSLPAHVDETLLGMGLPLINGYGLTETSPVLSVRLPERNRAGTIGPPLPRTRCEVRGPDGEVMPQGEIGILWASGAQIMRGYYRNDELTAQVLRDGWFDTGDLGRIEPHGEIRITGRAKDTIVLAGGENVEPERIETVLKTSPFIEQAVVVGQDQKSLGALLVANRDVLEQEMPAADLTTSDGRLTADAIRKLYRTEIDLLLSRDAGFRPYERVTRFHVLTEPMTQDNGLLTQTLKVKRHVVAERFGPVIDEMFGGKA